MDELIQQVSQRTGIHADQAKTAVETVIGFLKERLPAPVAAQLDGVIAGGGGSLGAQAQDVAGGLGGMLGGDRDR